MNLNLRPKEECMFDEISLGEIMLRLDPGEGRIKTARSFRAWEGGGEYNVARGLRRCFGMKTSVVTAFAENEIGYLMEDLILQGGVDTSLIKWMPFDGIGRTVRNGINFTERGFGIRGAVGASDRGNTAASQLKPGDIDWDYIFGTLGVRWLHTGGIYAALSESAAQVVIEAVKKAKQYGTVVSYDLNYRPSLWKGIGGQAKAQEVNKEIAKYVDVMIGNEEDFTASLGFEVEGNDADLKELNMDGYYKMIENTKFCRYIAPCKENTSNDDFYTEIGLYSKTPFTNPESLKRKFSWIMAEFLLHPSVSYEKRTDGWYMFVTDRANFNHYLEFARQAVEDE